MSVPRIRSVVVGAWIAAATCALLLGPSCSDARKRKKPEPAPAATAPAPAPAASAPAPVPAASTATPAAAGGLRPEDAPHAASFEVRLVPPARVAGLSLAVTYDPARFVAAEPKPAAALTGYMCQANIPPGSLRWSCVGLVNEARGGVLATFEMRGRERAPTLADLVLERVELVDEMSVTLTSAKVELAAAAPPPAR